MFEGVFFMSQQGTTFAAKPQRGIDSFMRTARKGTKRRGKRGESAIAAVIKGVLIGASITVIAVAVFALVVFAFLFRQGDFSQSEVLLFSFCGGMGLYHASAGIIPEQIAIGKALMSGAGFLCGTLLFACF